MDLNVNRPVHGLDLQCVDSNPNVYMDSYIADLPSFGPQSKAVFLNRGSSDNVGDGNRGFQPTLPEQVNPTPLEIQAAMAKVAGIISACFRSASMSAVTEAINTLVRTLESANGHQAPESILGEAATPPGIEVQMGRSEGIPFRISQLIRDTHVQSTSVTEVDLQDPLELDFPDFDDLFMFGTPFDDDVVKN